MWQKGACVAGEMTTAADGMHPTGMHSSIKVVLYQFCSCNRNRPDEALSLIMSFIIRSRDQGRIQDLKEGAATLKGVAAHYYHPQTKLWKGNVFTSVCQEFCPGGRVCTHQTATAADFVAS